MGATQQPVVARAPSGGAVVAAAGAGLALIGSLLPWWTNGGFSVNAWNMPFVGLFTRDGTLNGLKTGYLFIVPLLVVLPLLTRRPMRRWVCVALSMIPIDSAVLAWRLGGRAVGVGIFASIIGGLLIAYSSFIQRLIARRSSR
jgi:thiamine transporter ThiT